MKKLTLSEIRKRFTEEYYFDRKTARRAVRFFETELQHIEGEKAQTKLKLEPWQRRIVRRVFGWSRRSDGTRKYRFVYIEIPRRNGKSFLGSGFALYLLFADKEPGAQVVSAAADREQAAIVYDTAREIVDRNPKLKELANAYKRSMGVPSTASTYKVLSADANTKHGRNLHGIIVDELHAQPNRDLVDVLRTGRGSRRNPLMIYLTTAGYDKNTICYEQHEYARGILNNTIEDPHYYAAIHSADEKDDWQDEETWKKANPNLGVTITMDYLREEYEQAKELPAFENTFKRLYLNIWTEQETRWLPIEKWDNCEAKYLAEDLHGRPCYGGLDISATQDISALSLIFPPHKEERDWKTLYYYWVPEETVRTRSRRDKVPYDLWIKEGLIETTPGPITDQRSIIEAVIGLNKLFWIKELAIDRWNATQLAIELKGYGIKVILFGQGYADMNAPTKGLYTKILLNQLKHNGNKVQRWMVSNASVEMDAAGNLKLSKKKSTEKIDGVVALAMAAGRADVKESNSASIYSERGLLVL